MNREEFLEILNTQLQGEIPSTEVSQHLAYYDRFIQQKISQGQTEDQVLEELGDPRLIAKTLIDTEDIPNIQGFRQSFAYSAEESAPAGGDSAPEDDDEFQSQSQDEETGREDFQKENSQPKRARWLNLSTWRGTLAAIAVALVIYVLLATLIGALLPVIGIALLAGIIISLINRRR